MKHLWKPWKQELSLGFCRVWSFHDQEGWKGTKPRGALLEYMVLGRCFCKSLWNLLSAIPQTWRNCHSETVREVDDTTMYPNAWSSRSSQQILLSPWGSLEDKYFHLFNITSVLRQNTGNKDGSRKKCGFSLCIVKDLTWLYSRTLKLSSPRTPLHS